MPDALFLNMMRYLNELYEEKKLNREQVVKLAEFVVAITEECEGKPAQKTETTAKRKGFIDIETMQILHDVVPELRDKLESDGMVLT